MPTTTSRSGTRAWKTRCYGGSRSATSPSRSRGRASSVRPSPRTTSAYRRSGSSAPSSCAASSPSRRATSSRTASTTSAKRRRSPSTAWRPISNSNQNIGGVRAVACGPGPTRAVDCSGERAGPFQWEILQEGKDYYVDASGAWFALASRLDQNDYLAVSYVPVGVAACGPGQRCVGTFPVGARQDTSVVDTLRLVYDPKLGVTATSPSFRFEIRSAYRVGGSEIVRETVRLTLTVNQRERTVLTGDTYLAHLGLALATDPTTFDQYNRLYWSNVVGS